MPGIAAFRRIACFSYDKCIWRPYRGDLVGADPAFSLKSIITNKWDRNQSIFQKIIFMRCDLDHTYIGSYGG